MKKNTYQLKLLGIGLGVLFFIYLTYFILIFKRPFQYLFLFTNKLAYDNVYSFTRSNVEAELKKSIDPSKIIAVPFDNYSYKSLQKVWPCRNLLADLVKALDKEGVSVLGFDFVFQGESGNPQDDLQFKEALKSSYTRVVLSYAFEKKEKGREVPIYPLDDFKEAAYSLGFIANPDTLDGISRSYQFSREIDDKKHYSLSVQLLAAYWKLDPEEIDKKVPDFTVIKPNGFVNDVFINFYITPKDTKIIKKISFYDLLTHLDKLKKEYGDNFLKGSLVLIYPEAELFHDIVTTPLGAMPGGYMHLNGILNIATQRFLVDNVLLTAAFLLFSLFAVFLILKYFDFAQGCGFIAGLLLAYYWILVYANIKSVNFDSGRLFAYVLFYYGAASFYKYGIFMAQLLKIKNKVTIDPVRNIFTLRYFYYRLGLENLLVKRHDSMNKGLFVVFVYLGSTFKDEVDVLAVERIKDIWSQIHPILSIKNSYWAMLSQDELIGCVLNSQSKMDLTANYLKNNLNVLFSQLKINSKVKVGYLKYKKDYRINELVFVAAQELRKKNEDIIVFKDNEFVNLLYTTDLKTQGSSDFLESLDQDIEEKNRQVLSLYESLKKEHSKTKEAFFEIINSLVNALEARDPYTQGHSQRVANYALKLAEKLNWASEDKDKLRQAALLHDLGKIGIPDSILHKKGGLTDEEFDFIRKHEIIGVRILQPLKEFAEILPWILYHHERWDGKGYPHGLGGNSIPLAAQIISVADVFDALTSGRDYKKAIALDEAVKELVKNKGAQFNPQLVDIFIEVVMDPANLNVA